MSLPARLLLHLVAAGFGTYVAFAPTFDSGFALIQTDPGDTALNHYLLEHTWRWASDPAYHHGFWSPPFFHPQPTVLAYSENMIGVVPLYWLFRLFLPTALAFQVWMLVLSVLNYVGMALVLRRLPVGPGERLPPVLVAVGSLLWAFGLPQQLLIAHPQLLGRFWMPPAAYCAWRLAAAPSVSLLRWVLLFDFLQVLICINSGWLLTLGLGVYLPIAVWANGTGRRLWEAVRGRRTVVLAAVGLWAAGILLLAYPYLAANPDQGRDYGECLLFMPTFSSLLAGPDTSPWSALLWHVRDDVNQEAQFFAGFGFYALLGLAVWGVRTARADEKVRTARRFAVAGLTATAVVFLLTVDLYDGVSLWWFVRFLPGGKAIRAVGRVQMILSLLLIPAVMVGFALWLRSRVPAGRGRTAAVLLAAAAVAAEQTGHPSTAYDKAEVYGKAARVAEAAKGADTFYLVPAAGDNPLYPAVIAMWAGLDAGVPTVNGYSGRVPSDYPEEFHADTAEVEQWLRPRFRGRVRIVDPNTEPWAVRDYVLP